MIARLLTTVATAGLVGLTSAQTFQIAGTSGFIQDLDANDGVDLLTGLAGTWTGSFTLPDPSSLTFVNNTQNQGGSLTRYNGVTLNSLVLSTADFGELTITDKPITGSIALWDRASFGAGQRLVQFDFEFAGTSIGIDFSANADDPTYGSLFTVGTPGANTLDSFAWPFFGNAGEAGALYNSFSISLDGNTPVLPGRGRYNGNASSFIPAPSTGVLLGVAGLAATRRRR